MDNTSRYLLHEGLCRYLLTFAVKVTVFLPSLNGFNVLLCYLHIIKNFIIKKIKIADDINGDFDGYDVFTLLNTDTETDKKMACVELCGGVNTNTVSRWVSVLISYLCVYLCLSLPRWGQCKTHHLCEEGSNTEGKVVNIRMSHSHSGLTQQFIVN